MSKDTVHEQLVGLYRNLSEIIRRKQFTTADQSRLIEIGEEIRNTAESMTQCDGCDRIVDSVVRITMEGETASLCPKCGIRALREGRIILREDTVSPSPQKRSSSTTRKKPSPRPAARPSPKNSSKSTGDLYAEVEAASGLTKNDIRRLQKIIEGVAIPMDAEKTLAYVKAELKGDRKKIDEAKIEKAIPLLLGAS